MFDYLLDKLQKADVQVYPYKWIYIENFLKEEHYKKLKKEFNRFDWIKKIAYNKINYFDENVPNDVARDHCYNTESDYFELNDFFGSAIWYNAMCNKFEVDCSHTDVKNTVYEFLLDFPEHYIPRHNDFQKSKKPVFQASIYMPDQSYFEFGTILYDKDSDNYIETAMKENSILIYGTDFNNADHGTKPGDRIRKSMLVRWRT
jgi:hypothetical protein